MEDITQQRSSQPEWEKRASYAKELQLIKAVIRYGEKAVCYIEEDGEEIPLSVITYISTDLSRDGLQLQNPAHRKLLSEAESHLKEPNFCTERYFLTHPDPSISKMAADMINDQYRLSKSNEQAFTKDTERLHELIPHLLIDFKLAALEEEMKRTIQQLNSPEVNKDAQRALDIMTRYKELTDTLKKMAKKAGDRVILKA